VAFQGVLVLLFFFLGRVPPCALQYCENVVAACGSASPGDVAVGPVYTARARRAQTRGSQWERFVSITPQSR